MEEFIINECEVDSDNNEEEIIKSETVSDREFLDDDSVVNVSVSDYRRADRFVDMGPGKSPVYLRDFTPGAEPIQKVSCEYCHKSISYKNIAKHRKICMQKHTFCTYDACRLWVKTTEFKVHYDNHFSIVCKWCGLRIKYEDYSEHEVEERLKELTESGLEKNLKTFQQEYEKNYVVWCKANKYRAKTMINWLEDKLKRGQINDEFFQYAVSKLEKKDNKKKKPVGDNKKKKKRGKKKRKESENNDDDDKENCEPEGGKQTDVKKCKSENKKPSQNFEVTMHLKYTWIFTTIIKYILSTFFDGYIIPSRFKKTWPLGSRSTTLFPHPARWSLLQRKALEKKTAIRNRLRSNVKRPSNFDPEYFRLKYFDYNLNPKKYFRKRFIRPIPFIQEWIAAKEYGLGAPLHCHMYIKTKEKMYINTVRRFFRRFKFLGKALLENIATLKSPRDWVKYVTKEDHGAIVRNVDREKCNNNFIMWNFAKLSKDCNMSMYSNYRWNTYGQLNKYREIHACYWEPIIKREAYERAMQLLDPIQKIHIEKIVKLCLKTTIKGIYLWGEPKTGKSTTALAISEGSHFQVPEGNTTFAFHSWKNEPFILFEDISADQFLHFRNKINQLCDEHGLCFAQTKGGGSKLIQCKKVIVTSNYAPPLESEWPGFERRFLCIKYEKIC